MISCRMKTFLFQFSISLHFSHYSRRMLLGGFRGGWLLEKQMFFFSFLKQVQQQQNIDNHDVMIKAEEWKKSLYPYHSIHQIIHFKLKAFFHQNYKKLQKPFKHQHRFHFHHNSHTSTKPFYPSIPAQPSQPAIHPANQQLYPAMLCYACFRRRMECLTQGRVTCLTEKTLVKGNKKRKKENERNETEKREQHKLFIHSIPFKT